MTPNQVRLEPMTAERFRDWARASRAGFAEQQVASGSMPPAEAEEYADRSFAQLLPEGLGTLGHHIFTAYDGAAEVGHVWVRISEHSDGLDAFLFDIELLPPARGRGLGRATMLAVEAAARDLGATRMRLNVFGPNRAARALYESLGYRPTSTNMTRCLERTTPVTVGAEPSVVLRPMSARRFGSYRVQAEADYAGAIAQSGMLPGAEARVKSADDLRRLLPDGLDTAEHFFWTAHQAGCEAGPEVGVVWLNIAPRSDGLHAFGYDLSVPVKLRGHGYCRAIVVAAERICRDRGVLRIGLNVFGSAAGASALYAQMGFEVTAQLLRKQL